MIINLMSSENESPIYHNHIPYYGTRKEVFNDDKIILIKKLLKIYDANNVIIRTILEKLIDHPNKTTIIENIELLHNRLSETKDVNKEFKRENIRYIEKL